MLTATDKIKVYSVDNPEWGSTVSLFDNFDIYYLPGYVRAFQINGDGMPYLVHYNNNGLEGIYSFILRKLEDGFFDIITPYGYGGWLLKGEKNELNLKNLHLEWHNFALVNNIVDNFVRFHPLLDNANDNRGIANVIDLGQIIALDLSSEEIIWENLTSKNRNMIRKAQKNGVVIKHDKGMDILEKFIPIYNATMKNDDADLYYFFSHDFYESIHKDLHDNYEVFYALYDDKIISIAIILFANQNMHYHLSGSVYEYRHLAPSNLLLFEAAKWGCQQGFKNFHLGGGVGSGQDPLFKFKAAFNRNGGLQFSIGKEIFNQEKYDELVSLRILKDSSFNKDSQFFPLYRS